MAARQAERIRREDEREGRDSDNDSDSDDSISRYFNRNIVRFSPCNYVSPPPTVTRRVATLVESANVDMQEGKLDISKDFCAPFFR